MPSSGCLPSGDAGRIHGLRVIAELALVFVFVLACGVARAVAAQSEAVRVSPPGEQAEERTVAVDSVGNGTVAWIQQELTTNAEFEVMTASRDSLTGGWTAPVAVSDVEAEPDSEQLAVGANGAAVLAWLEGRSQGPHHRYVDVVEASDRASAQSAWQAPLQVSPDGQNVGELALGIDAVGRPLIVWSLGYGIGGAIEAASGSTRDNTWGPPCRLAVGGSSGSADDGSGLQLAVNDRGEAVAVWQHMVSQRPQHPKGFQLPTVTSAVMAASRAADGHWSVARRIGTAIEQRQLEGGNIWTPPTQRVTLDDQGGATVVWNTQHADTQRLMDAIRPPGSGGWLPPTVLSGQTAYGPVVASDGRGNETAAWLDTRGQILTTSRSSHGDWSPAHALPGSESSATVWLSVDPRGDAIIAWVRSHYPAGRELVSFRAGPLGPWRAPVDVGAGEYPAGALDPHGSATIVWARLITAHHSGYNVIDAAVHAFRYTMRSALADILRRPDNTATCCRVVTAATVIMLTRRVCHPYERAGQAVRGDVRS